jgi:hypothetical protein
MKKNLIYAITLFLMAWSNSIFAQHFTLGSFGIGLGNIVQQSALYQVYEPTVGLLAYATLNYGKSELYVQGQYHRFNASKLRTFSSQYYLLGYQYPIDLPWKIKLKPGFAFGANHVEFSDPQPEENSKETELALAASLVVSRNLTPHFSLFCQSNITRVYNYKRHDLYSVNIGLSYHFTIPKLIKHFLD